MSWLSTKWMRMIWCWPPLSTAPFYLNLTFDNSLTPHYMHLDESPASMWVLFGSSFNLWASYPLVDVHGCCFYSSQSILSLALKQCSISYYYCNYCFYSTSSVYEIFSMTLHCYVFPFNELSNLLLLLYLSSGLSCCYCHFVKSMIIISLRIYCFDGLYSCAYSEFGMSLFQFSWVAYMYLAF
jgi:hypothetical protein